MNELSVLASIRMSSREIADLVEKRHDNVKRTIETLAEKGIISKPQIEDGEKSANGVVEEIYVFTAENKRDTYIVVAQLSPEFTARLVDRWQELEKGKVPTTYIEMLRAHLATEEAKEAALLQIEVDRPYTALGRALVATDETMVRRDWVNLLKKEQGLQVGEKKVDAWLIESGYCYRENIANNMRAYSHFAHLLKLELETVISGGKPLQVKILKLTGQGILELTPLVLSHFNGNQ